MIDTFIIDELKRKEREKKNIRLPVITPLTPLPSSAGIADEKKPEITPRPVIRIDFFS